MNILLFKCMVPLVIIKLTISINTNNSILKQLIVVTNQQRVIENEITKILYRKFNNHYPKEAVYSKLADLDVKNLQDFGKYLKIKYFNFSYSAINPLSLKVFSTDSNNYNISAHTILSQIFQNHSFYFKEKQSLIFPVGPLEIASLDIYLTFKLEYQDYLQLNSGKEDILKNLSQQSQIDFKDYILFSLKANQLLNQKYLNLSFPAWAQKNLKEIISAQNYLYNFLYGDKNIAKIMSGPLLNYIVTELKNQIFINPFVFYLTDDSMLCSMLTLINSPCNSTPEMASSLIFEVSETSNKEHHVKVFFVNKTTQNNTFSTNLINIEGCNEACSLEKFIDSMKKANGYEPDFQYLIINRQKSI